MGDERDRRHALTIGRFLQPLGCSLRIFRHQRVRSSVVTFTSNLGSLVADGLLAASDARPRLTVIAQRLAEIEAARTPAKVDPALLVDPERVWESWTMPQRREAFARLARVGHSAPRRPDRWSSCRPDPPRDPLGRLAGAQVPLGLADVHRPVAAPQVRCRRRECLSGWTWLWREAARGHLSRAGLCGLRFTLTCDPHAGGTASRCHERLSTPTHDDLAVPGPDWVP